MSNNIKTVTCIAPVNIAVIKYWGKRDEKFILPLNSSLSLTLNTADLSSTTTITASKELGKDSIILNDAEQSTENKRLQVCLREMREISTKQHGSQNDENRIENLPVQITSKNNFPTAAGLASSSSGYCCLVTSLANLYGVKETYKGELSAIARQGSGSACRSMYGGWVKWDKGVKSDGSDSIAVQVADENHWPEIQVMILVVSDQQKHTSSTSGMQTSVATNRQLHVRAEEIVPKRIVEIEKAILQKDFQTFSQLTMQDSDDFHQICNDTIPSIHYLNDTSKRIINLIHQINKLSMVGNKAAYTFDAGPNAVIFTKKEFLPELAALVKYYFPNKTLPLEQYFRSRPKILNVNSLPIVNKQITENINFEIKEDELKYILFTEGGPGPQRVN